MKSLSKLIFIMVMSGISLGFTSNALCMPNDYMRMSAERIGYLMGKLQENVLLPTDLDSAKKLNDNIKKTDQAETIYLSVLNAPKGAIDIQTIHALMDKWPSLAEKLFDLARDNEIANVDTYNLFITIEGQRKCYDSVVKAFNDAVIKKLANVDTFNVLIIESGRNGHFDDAKKYYDQTIKNRFSNVEVGNSYIIAAGLGDRFEEADMMFCELQKSGGADIDSYRNYIAAAGLTNHFDSAVKVFWQLLHKDVHDVDSCKIFYQAAYNTKHYDAAEVITRNINKDEVRYMRLELDMLGCPSTFKVISSSFGY